MNHHQDNPRVEAGLNDFLMLMLKAVVLKLGRLQGKPDIGLEKADILRAEECDLKFQKFATGDVKLAAIPGQDPAKSAIIVEGAAQNAIVIAKDVPK